MNTHETVRILFICMGNICRSPMAEGIFRHLLQEAGLAGRVYVDSAGTHAYHVGATPDPRSQQTASRRGVDLSTLRARHIEHEDFESFDYLLAMDQANYRDLVSLSPPTQRAKIRLFLDYAPELSEQEVPDPYYGGLGGFERAMDLLEAAAAGLLQHLRDFHHL